MPRCAPPVASGVASVAVSTRDVATLFGRLSEPVLYLDRNVGACCHSACSDCEWRDPAGGYRWDLMRSTVPKWIPCYLLRDFQDERGCHVPNWASALFPDGAGSTINRADFGERISALPFEMPMGPKGKITSETCAECAKSPHLLFTLLSNNKSHSRFDILHCVADQSRRPRCSICSGVGSAARMGCSARRQPWLGCRTCLSVRTAREPSARVPTPLLGRSSPRLWVSGPLSAGDALEVTRTSADRATRGRWP
jgi:hypothetical protein